MECHTSQSRVTPFFLQLATCLQKRENNGQWRKHELSSLLGVTAKFKKKIDKSHRNADVYTEIAKAVAKQGFPGRDWKQCRTKAKHLKAEFKTYNDSCKKSGNARKKEPTFFKELSNFLGDRPEPKGLDNYIDTGTSPDGEASVSEIQSKESSVCAGK